MSGVAHLDDGTRLMIALRGGDDAAFGELVDRYQGRVLGVLQRSVGRRDLAEDLCQEVFLRVYRARSTYEPRARFATWLFRIVHNLAINHAEHARRRETVSADSQGDEGGGQVKEIIDSAAPSPPEVLERDELRAKVREAVMALSPHQRMATIYSKYHGMSYEEVAEIMEMRVEAVKSLLFRARERIRERLLPYLSEEVCRGMS
ncbi:MAG: sigma-70 family RNA polymerase sigma factor [Planctomycetota bacterium]